MFSGIVQGKGKILKIVSKKNHISLEISAPKNFNKRLKKGASISVNGVCLTSLDERIPIKMYKLNFLKNIKNIFLKKVTLASMVVV